MAKLFSNTGATRKRIKTDNQRQEDRRCCQWTGVGDLPEIRGRRQREAGWSPDGVDHQGGGKWELPATPADEHPQ